MSSGNSRSTQSGPGNIFYYSSRPESRYGMTSAPQFPLSGSHTLPPPSTLASRPYLPPPSHLEPTFVPQSPQGRPQYSDPSTRQLSGAGRPSPYDNTLYNGYRVTAPSSERSSCASSHPHPPLFPSKVSYQSTNPGTLYEALSPVEYGTHYTGLGGSLFSEGMYSASPYPIAPQQQPQQSPATSYKSSGTSSSGYGSGPMQWPQTTQALDYLAEGDSQAT